MSSVSSTSSTTSAFSTAATSETGGQTLGKDDFLKLLTAQLSNQDPLKPMDNTEFVAQLAQFSALEQQVQSNEHLTNLESAEAAMNNANVANLVGKTVTADGDTMSLEGGVPIATPYTLDGAATSVTVTVTDSSGNVVRTMQVGAQGAGSHSVTWDGNNDTGTQQPDGTYTISISATNASGQVVDASTQVTGVVTSVEFTASGAQLVIGATGQKIAPADVTAISNSL